MINLGRNKKYVLHARQCWPNPTLRATFTSDTKPGQIKGLDFPDSDMVLPDSVTNLEAKT